MADKYSIKTIQEMPAYRSVTTVGIKKYLKLLGMMSEEGRITTLGAPHAEYRDRKSDGMSYLAITKGIARKYVAYRKKG